MKGRVTATMGMRGTGGALVVPVNEHNVRLLKRAILFSDYDSVVEEVNGESLF